jgi:hypothetical protein
VIRLPCGPPRTSTSPEVSGLGVPVVSLNGTGHVQSLVVAEGDYAIVVAVEDRAGGDQDIVRPEFVDPVVAEARHQIGVEEEDVLLGSQRVTREDFIGKAGDLRGRDITLELFREGQGSNSMSWRASATATSSISSRCDPAHPGAQVGPANGVDCCQWCAGVRLGDGDAVGSKAVARVTRRLGKRLHGDPSFHLRQGGCGKDHAGP